MKTKRMVVVVVVVVEGVGVAGSESNESTAWERKGDTHRLQTCFHSS